jgi:hypothetical protein
LHPIPLLDFVNGDKIADFPILCGIEPPRNSKKGKKKGKKSIGKKAAKGKKAVRLA